MAKRRRRVAAGFVFLAVFALSAIGYLRVSDNVASASYYYYYYSPPDTSPPVTSIHLTPSSPNGSNGWYVTQVHVSVSATDPDGPADVAETRCVLDPASAPLTFGDIPAGCSYAGAGADVFSDGAQTVYAASKDQIGNEELPVSVGFRIDTTPPTVTCVTPMPVFVLNGLGGPVSATVTDATSGPVASPISAPANVTSPGLKSVTLTGKDMAGNTTTVTCPYAVGWKIEGPFSPIPQAHYQRGSTIPVKFSLADFNDVLISNATAQAIAAACGAKVTFNGFAPVCAVYDSKPHQFSANVKTSKTTALGLQTITINVYIGSTLVATKSVQVLIVPS